MTARPGETVFFTEGQGFWLVEHIQTNFTGTKVCIVRDSRGELYIRKEPMIVNDVDEHYGERHEEVRTYLPVAHMPNVVPLKGWTSYISGERSRGSTLDAQVTTATYWKFCSIGDLYDIRTRLMRAGKTLPEPCLWYVMTTMVKILLQMWDVGVSQNDEHEGNWFFDYESSQSHCPTIFIGDFDMAILKQDVRRDHWYGAQRKAFPKILRCLQLLINPLTPMNYPVESTIQDLLAHRRVGRDTYSLDLIRAFSHLNEIQGLLLRDRRAGFVAVNAWLNSWREITEAGRARAPDHRQFEVSSVRRFPRFCPHVRTEAIVSELVSHNTLFARYSIAGRDVATNLPADIRPGARTVHPEMFVVGNTHPYNADFSGAQHRLLQATMMRR